VFVSVDILDGFLKIAASTCGSGECKRRYAIRLRRICGTINFWQESRRRYRKWLCIKKFFKDQKFPLSRIDKKLEILCEVIRV